MAGYRFVTVWRFRAPINAVWEALVDSEKWPQWWQGVASVEEVRPPNPDGLGGVRRYVWRSRLPYNLAFDMEVTQSQHPNLLEGRAGGELEGTGTWRLTETNGVTTVGFTWEVHTTRPWMNLMAPQARRLFAWNHDYVMARGGEGLAALLGVELLPT